jgi:putative membrane protein
VAKYWHFALFLMGLGGLIFLIVEVGPRNILDRFAQMGWRLALLVALYFVPYFFDALGWRFAFERLPRALTPWRLFWIRVAGEAVNNTTWTMDVGGEPVKAALLSRYGIQFPEAMASVVIAKTTMVMAQVIFMLAGLVALFLLPNIPVELTGVTAGITALGAVAMGVFFLVQSRGFFSFIGKLGERFPPTRKFVASHRAKIGELDERLGGYYKRHHWRFAASIGCHLLGWLTGTVEIYLILTFLGLPGDWRHALVIECLHHLVRTIVFFMPMNLGNQEGGNYAIFHALGYEERGYDPLEIGVGISLIRRIRELAWASAGWVALMILAKDQLPALMKHEPPTTE